MGPDADPRCIRGGTWWGRQSGSRSTEKTPKSLGAHFLSPSHLQKSRAEVFNSRPELKFCWGGYKVIREQMDAENDALVAPGHGPTSQRFFASPLEPPGAPDWLSGIPRLRQIFRALREIPPCPTTVRAGAGQVGPKFQIRFSHDLLRIGK